MCEHEEKKKKKEKEKGKKKEKKRKPQTEHQQCYCQSRSSNHYYQVSSSRVFSQEREPAMSTTKSSNNKKFANIIIDCNNEIRL
jgi:hypothetical protein